MRTRHPDERIYTFWKYFGGAFARDTGLRIDHMLLSPSVASRLKDAGVHREVRSWEKTSDHAPVWIEIGTGKKDARKAPKRPRQGTRAAAGR